MSYEINLTEAREKITTLAVSAGSIARENFRSEELEIVKRGGVDIVTETDQVINRFLMEGFVSSFPGMEVMAEESYDDDNPYHQAEFLIIVDDLDGSKNFSKRIPHFAVSIALARMQRVLLGVVYKPMTDELYWVQEGVEGAWLNSKRIKVSGVDNLKEATFACDWVA